MKSRRRQVRLLFQFITPTPSLRSPPVTPFLPFFGESATIDVSLDGTTIKLPDALIQPEYRELFDGIIDWAYDEAIDAQAKGSATHLNEKAAGQFLDGAASASGITLPAELIEALTPAVIALVYRMAELACAGRNGIWAFILRNTYRPGFSQRAIQRPCI